MICKIIDGEPKQVAPEKVFNLKISSQETELGCRECDQLPEAIVMKEPRLR